MLIVLKLTLTALPEHLLTFTLSSPASSGQHFGL